MRFIWRIVFFWFSFASASFGQADVYASLYEALHLGKVVKILRDESVKDALGSGKLYLGQDYDFASFEKAVEKVFNLEMMDSFMRNGLKQKLPREKAKVAYRFFSQDLGARVALLETSARSAISYEEVEVAAIQMAKEAKSENTARYSMLEKNLKALELVELNMKGAFSAQYAFLKNLSTLDDMPLNNDDIVALLLENEEEMRREIVDWLMGFTHMAYTPLTDEELKSYLGFLSSSDGKVLNETLFYIFNDLSIQTSGELGGVIVSFRKAREL